MINEREIRAIRGLPALLGTIALVAVGGVLMYAFISSIPDVRVADDRPAWALLLGSVVCLFLAAFSTCGYFTLQPNEARVLILFGAYRGTRSSKWTMIARRRWSATCWWCSAASRRRTR